MDAEWGPNSLAVRITELVEQYQPELLRMCAMLLSDKMMAEDAVQETFIKAMRALPTFRGGCSEKSWLMGIAVNTCRDMRRSAWFRHVWRKKTPEDLPEPVGPEDQAAVDMALTIAALPASQKEVLLLYYYENMTTAEIADALGVAGSTVSRRLKQAVKVLRGLLEVE